MFCNLLLVIDALFAKCMAAGEQKHGRAIWREHWLKADGASMLLQLVLQEGLNLRRDVFLFRLVVWGIFYLLA